MKKTIFTIISAILLCSVTFAEKQYRSIIIDGGEISKWMNFVSEDEYDTNGNCTHSKDNYAECFRKFDKNNNCIYEKNTYSERVTEFYYKYDKNNNRIYSKQQNPDGSTVESYYEYDTKNRITSLITEVSDGTSMKDITTYDNEGNSCTKNNRNRYEFYCKYTNGNLIEERQILKGSKQEYIYRYNDYGDTIYYYHLSGSDAEEYETSYKYNKEGDKIYKKQKGEETFFSYDYEYYDNGKLKKKITYSTN